MVTTTHEFPTCANAVFAGAMWRLSELGMKMKEFVEKTLFSHCSACKRGLEWKVQLFSLFFEEREPCQEHDKHRASGCGAAGMWDGSSILPCCAIESMNSRIKVLFWCGREGFGCSRCTPNTWGVLPGVPAWFLGSF